jgi:hypothetical protein
MKALQSRHLTPAQGREKKKILGCWPVALPPANTPNPDFEKALVGEQRGIVFGDRNRYYYIDKIHSPREGVPMYWKKIFAISTLLILIFVSACTLPVGQAVPGATNPPGAGPAATNPPAAVPLDTQVAQMVASTLAAQTALANDAAATLAAASTNTPEFTFTPSLTPTMTFTLTPSVPMVTVSVNTNCRSGPGEPYAILGVLMVGQSAEVVGQNPVTASWIIKLTPSGPTCWLTNIYATATGNTAGLPVVNPPPSPTPPGSFTVAYASKQTCASGYGIKFLINNNGSQSWESNQVTATDKSTSETKTVQYDTFPNYSSANCSLLDSSENLDPGESGTTSVFGFSANPTGHEFSATIKVCSKNGLSGVCLEKTISFTP